MKHITRILFCILILNFFHANATNVSGNVYGHWTLANSPYNVVNNINIPSDSTLIIDAGVDVTFNANYEMKIDGRVLAIGTVTDSISFTAPNLFPGFAGIRFEVTNATQDSSIFEYCIVKNANRGTQFLTGMDNYGGGFLINNFNKVRIQHCSITYCRAFDGGAGICIYNSSNISILDNYIAYNNALDASSSVNDGGGILCKGGSSPIICRNEISYNTAAGHGGAIYVSGGSPQISDNLITRNNIYPCWFSGNCNVNVVNNTFTYNNLTNGNTGAPISVNQAINVLIQNNTITNNVNSNYGGFLKGGGIFVGTATTILIKGNTITKNRLSVSTSGYVLEGGGIYCNTTNKAYIINNFISNNTGAANGGGVYIKNGFLINNVICNNMASGGTPSDGKGGGVCTQDTVVLINNTITNNYAQKGGGVYINGRRNSKMYNCIVWGNDVSSSGKGRQVYCNNAQTTFNYTIINCDIDSGQARIGLLNNNLQGMIYQNNIDTIPGFVNPTDTAWVTADATLADWTLMNSSACINAGDSSLVSEITDISGNTRVYDTNVDMGAYESQSIILNLPTANFTLTNDTLCANESLQLSNQSTNATTYLWIFQDGTPATSTEQNPIVTWTLGGQKLIQLIATNNSGVDSLSQIVTTYSVDTSVLVGNASLLANATNSNYQWLSCESGYAQISGATNQTFTPNQPTEFFAVEVTQNGCIDTSACYAMIVTLDHTNHNQWELVQLYPNPVNDILTVSIPYTLNAKNSIVIIQNTLGETIFTKVNCDTAEIIDLSAFAKGVYFVRLDERILKFVKE